MKNASRYVKLLAISVTAGLVWGNGCLIDNFWSIKLSEVINRGIFGVINAALGQAGPI